MRRRYIKLAILIVVLPIGAFTVGSAEESGLRERQSITSENDAPALRFQRVMVPADRPEDWPRDKHDRYLPMPADEFERRVAQLRDRAPSVTEPVKTQLIRA